MSCNSKFCVDDKNEFSQRRSIKPDWHKAHARFIINLCMEKERGANNGNNNTAGSFSSSYESLFSCGWKNNTSSPDVYVWRQRYLRSYNFTREEESSDERKKKGLRGVVLGKVKRWYEPDVRV
ncbi:unnamed protein product [Linum tenue]|uniref:Uncharacterized protein n=1 Tax=Linum tenue TaxID=586396 RepID=A0AAV0L4L9_9ROSI|nr:unnamed protein product [Linum tenue]